MTRTRVALFLGVSLLVSLLSGCGSAQAPAKPEDPAPPPPAETATVKDGTYFGVSAGDARGNYATLEITIEAGKITKADFAEINGADGLPKTADNYTYEPTLQVIEDLPKSLLETQDPETVDAIAGATGTVANFKEAAKSALAKADKDHKTGVMRDGEYKLVSGKDARGYWSEAIVTISGGEFGKVDYQEYSAATGKSKRESGYTYDISLDAIDTLAAQMNEVKDLSKVDDVTGATGTSHTFKEMVQFAFDLAKSADGVYTYKGDKDERGNWIEATLALSGGKISSYRYVEFDGNSGKPKDDTYPHEAAVKFFAGNGLQVFENQYGADFVTGATHSHEEHATLLRNLLDEAIK